MCRAGLEGDSMEIKGRFLHLPNQCRCQYRVSQGCPGARGDGSRELETRAHITNVPWCAAEQFPLSCCDWFHGKGHSSSPEGTEAPLIIALNFLVSLLTFCQSCFQGNLSHSLLCCQVGVVWNAKNTLKPTAQFRFFVWAFENLKKGSSGSAAESAFVGCDFWTWFLWSNFTQNFDV